MHAKVLLLVLVLFVASFANALSPDEAITFVSNTNNYLLSGESAGILEPKVTILNQGDEYWIVAGLNDTTPNVYIPVSNKTEQLAQGDITIRNLITTEIVLTKIVQLKNSSYGLSWPFSYSTRTTFDGLSTDLQNMVPKVQVVQTTLADIGTSDSRKLELVADDTQAMISDLATMSATIAQRIDTYRAYEDNYLATPDTNQTATYKTNFDAYDTLIAEYKTEYTAVQTNLNQLQQGIATLQTSDLSQSDRDGLINYLKLPASTGKLPSFFSQNDQTKTAIGAAFAASANIEGLVLNLETRKTRNATWQLMYGADAKITKLNKSFYSLSDASEAILLEDNAPYWADQESVAALKINWQQAKTRYSNQEYDKASDFAKKAESNVLAVLEKGVAAQDSGSGQDIINQVIIVLIVAVIGVFAYENFIVKKKKGGSNDEQYSEP